MLVICRAIANGRRLAVVAPPSVATSYYDHTYSVGLCVRHENRAILPVLIFCWIRAERYPTPPIVPSASSLPSLFPTSIYLGPNTGSVTTPPTWWPTPKTTTYQWRQTQFRPLSTLYTPAFNFKSLWWVTLVFLLFWCNQVPCHCHGPPIYQNWPQWLSTSDLFQVDPITRVHVHVYAVSNTFYLLFLFCWLYISGGNTFWQLLKCLLHWL